MGRLLKIISDGVRGGNPNGVRVEIEKRVGRPIPTTLPAQVGDLESQVSVLRLVWSHVSCTGRDSNGGHTRASPISEGDESGSVSRPTSPAVCFPSPSKNTQNQQGINPLQLVSLEESTMDASTEEARLNNENMPKFDITYRRRYQSALPHPRRGKWGDHLATDTKEQMGAFLPDVAVMGETTTNPEVIGSSMGAAHEALIGVDQVTK